MSYDFTNILLFKRLLKKYPFWKLFDNYGNSILVRTRIISGDVNSVRGVFTIFFYNYASNEELMVIHRNDIECVEFIKDGKFVIRFSSDSGINLLDSETFDEIAVDCGNVIYRFQKSDVEEVDLG